MDPRSSDINTIQGKVSAALKKKIDAGELGVNAGKGFYDYTDE